MPGVPGCTITHDKEATEQTGDLYEPGRRWPVGAESGGISRIQGREGERNRASWRGALFADRENGDMRG